MHYSDNSRQMRITRLIFTETGTYNDAFNRPYKSDLSPYTLSQMQEATRGGERFSAQALAGVAGQILRPSAQAEGTVSIVNGWDTRRLRFMMEIEHTSFGGMRNVQFVSGYTDYVGVSLQSNAIDPNMRLYLNQSIMTRQSQVMTPVGLNSQLLVSSTDHLLTGQYAPSVRSLGASTHLMRPQDVFDISASTVFPHVQPGTEVFDLRTTFAGTTPVRPSRRSNGSAPVYLSKVMESNSIAMANADEDFDLSKLYNKASEQVRENLMSANAFIAALDRQTSFGEEVSVTYGELCRMQPGLDDIVVVSLNRGVTRNDVHARGSTEHWHGSNNETVCATILSNSVPALMADLMLTGVAFMATNQTIGGAGMHVQLLGATSFAQGLDLSPYLQMFTQRLINEVLADLTMNNMMDVALTCQFDMLGETIIDISLQGQPSVRFTTPSFADAMLVPVITNNHQVLATLASDITNLLDNLSVSHANPALIQRPAASLTSSELFNDYHSAV